jgi:hypothetical protein
MRSHRRGLDSVTTKLREWRNERTVSHERGLSPEPVPEVDPTYDPRWDYMEGEGEEIELFNPSNPVPIMESAVVGYLSPEAILRRQIDASGYNESVTHSEDPRLKID